MEDKKFVTQTVPKTSIVYCTFLTALLAIIFTAAYFLFPHFSTYIFLGGSLLCISCFGAGLILLSSSPVTLRFKNDDLFITDTNGKEYHVFATSVSDFIFIQTPLEKKYNVGCLIIKHTSFFMVCVNNISETKEYLNDNFPHW